MATVFQSLASHRGIRKLSSGLVIENAKDYAPRPDDHDYIRRNDAPWIKRFASAGGEAIISGDQKMRSDPAEREALVQTGMVVFFFDPAWNNFKFCDKCAMLLHWWPQTLGIAETAPKPSFWRIPATWNADAGIAQVSHADLSLELVERQKAAAPKIRARRAPAQTIHPAQPELDLLETKNDKTSDKQKA